MRFQKIDQSILNLTDQLITFGQGCRQPDHKLLQNIGIRSVQAPELIGQLSVDLFKLSNFSDFWTAFTSEIEVIWSDFDIFDTY